MADCNRLKRRTRRSLLKAKKGSSMPRNIDRSVRRKTRLEKKPAFKKAISKRKRARKVGGHVKYKFVFSTMPSGTVIPLCRKEGV